MPTRRCGRSPAAARPSRRRANAAEGSARRGLLARAAPTRSPSRSSSPGCPAGDYVLSATTQGGDSPATDTRTLEVRTTGESAARSAGARRLAGVPHRHDRDRSRSARTASSTVSASLRAERGRVGHDRRLPPDTRVGSADVDTSALEADVAAAEAVDAGRLHAGVRRASLVAAIERGARRARTPTRPRSRAVDGARAALAVGDRAGLLVRDGARQAPATRHPVARQRLGHRPAGRRLQRADEPVVGRERTKFRLYENGVLIGRCRSPTAGSARSRPSVPSPARRTAPTSTPASSSTRRGRRR